MQIDKQRCFKIPNKKLDLFLVQLKMLEERELLRLEAEYIFEAGKFYDVVVNYYGYYPCLESQLESFAFELLKPKLRRRSALECK